MLRKGINKGLKKFGLELQKISKQKEAGMNNEFTMFRALERCLNRGININTVIDVGASDGCWTKKCLAVLPNAHYLLIEAQEPHKQDLEILSAQNSLRCRI